MDEVEEVFDFLAANPSSDQILKAVYKVKTNHVSKFKRQKISEQLMTQKLREVGPFMNTEESKLDAQFKESIKLAEEFSKKCKIVN